MAQPEFQARLQRRSAVYFAVGGPPVAQASFEGTAPHRWVSVVAVEGDMIRILHRVTHGQVLFWLPRDDLKSVIGEKVRLAHAPDQKPNQNDIGVTVFPGAALSRLGSRGGFTEVQGDGIFFYFRGWVPDGIFRDIYRLDGPARPVWVTPEGEFEHLGDLRSGALVYDRPDGRVIAVAARNQQRTVYANETDIEGWWLMEFANIEFRIRRYVHSFDVDEHELLYGVGAGGRYGGGNRIIATVPADTSLLDRPDGEIVGRTLSDQSLAIAAEPDGGYRVETNSKGGARSRCFCIRMATTWGRTDCPRTGSTAARRGDCKGTRA